MSTSYRTASMRSSGVAFLWLTNYGKRSLVETAIERYKLIITHRLGGLIPRAADGSRNRLFQLIKMLVGAREIRLVRYSYRKDTASKTEIRSFIDRCTSAHDHGEPSVPVASQT